MYEIIKNVINRKDYKLEEMLYKINKMYVENTITETQKEELDNLARKNANAQNSYAPLQSQIDSLYEQMKYLEERISLLENDEQTTDETDEYKEYVAPSGAHDAYNTGDKVIFNGKKYICKMDNCVWSPEVYPSAWEETKEESEEV